MNDSRLGMAVFLAVVFVISLGVHLLDRFDIGKQQEVTPTEETLEVDMVFYPKVRHGQGR